MNDTVRIERMLPASPAQVWLQLTNQEQIQKWTGEHAKFISSKNEAYTLMDEWISGNILEVESNTLTMSWRCADWDQEWGHSEVVWKLSSLGADTKLVIEHKAIPNEEEMKKQAVQWEEFFLTPLEDYLMIVYNR
jgi:uncharacterized protein YndB with AHSA1/START domain